MDDKYTSIFFNCDLLSIVNVKLINDNNNFEIYHLKICIIMWVLEKIHCGILHIRMRCELCYIFIRYVYMHNSLYGSIENDSIQQPVFKCMLQVNSFTKQ